MAHWYMLGQHVDLWLHERSKKSNGRNMYQPELASLSGIEDVVDVLEEGLVDDLRVAEKEHRRLTCICRGLTFEGIGLLVYLRELLVWLHRNSSKQNHTSASMHEAETPFPQHCMGQSKVKARC